jgi:hypothetical protein
LALVTACAFGPYLSETIGVRTEQPVFLLFAFIFLPIVFRSSISWRTAGALFCFATVLLTGIIAWVFPVDLSSASFTTGSALAGFVNNLMPIAGILIATAWIALGYTREKIFRTVATVLVWAMSANSLVAVVQVPLNLSGILSHFWAATGSGNSTNTVAFLALANGRNTGIFNQPAQAGFLYGLAILFAVYLWGDRNKSHPKLFTFVVLLLALGGFLTVSKIFIVVALPLVFLLLLSQAHGRGKRILYLIGGLGAAAFVISITGWSFPGRKQIILDLSSPQHGGIVGLLSAGRLGSGGSLLVIFHAIATRSPIVGFGLAGISAAVDSDWIGVGVTAGLIGILSYVFLYVLLIRGFRRIRSDDATAGVMLCFLVLTFCGSFGFPIYTGNRISGILWILLTVCFLSDGPWTGQPSVENRIGSNQSNVIRFRSNIRSSNRSGKAQASERCP